MLYCMYLIWASEVYVDAKKSECALGPVVLELKAETRHPKVKRVKG